MNKESTLKIMNKIKNNKINIRKTIEKTATGKYIYVKSGYVDPVDIDNKIRSDFPQLIDNGKTYDDEWDEEFFDKVFECLNGNGIFISLAYVKYAESHNPQDYNETFKYRLEGFNYEVEEEENGFGYDSSEDYITYMEVKSASKNVLCNFHEFDEIEPHETVDYGIKVKKLNDSYETEIGIRVGGECGIPPYFDVFEDNDDYCDLWDINNPLNQLIIKLMNDVIIFEE